MDRIAASCDAQPTGAAKTPKLSSTRATVISRPPFVVVDEETAGREICEVGVILHLVNPSPWFFRETPRNHGN